MISACRHSQTLTMFFRLLILFALSFVSLAKAEASDTTITIITHPNADQKSLSTLIEAASQTGKPVTVELDPSPQTLPAQVLPIQKGQAPQAAASAATGSNTDFQALGSVYSMFQDSINRGLTIALEGLANLPNALQSSWKTLQEEQKNSGNMGTVTFLAIVGALVCSALFIIGFRQAIYRFAGRSNTMPKPAMAVARLILDLIAVGIFISLSHAAIHMALPYGSFQRISAINLAEIFSTTGFYAAAARFLFGRNLNHGPLLDVANAGRHLKMMIGLGLLVSFTSATLKMADSRGLDHMAIDGWAFITSTLVTLYKLCWFISGRRDIAKAFAGMWAGRIRSHLARFIADFYSFSALFIWVLGLMVAGTEHYVLWGRASGLSQLVFILVPIIDRALFVVLREAARKQAEAHHQNHDLNRTPSLGLAILWTMPIPLSGLVWLLGLYGTVMLWSPLFATAGMDPTPWLDHVRQISLTLIASWTACCLLWKYFDNIAPAAAIPIPGQDDDHANRETSRLTTILPLARNISLGLFGAVAVLIILQSAGLDVAPLLAGFGVLGLALSFGSQTLVKDVVSGIFFLAEDAFRIGEYIDTGRLKGTVEQISLRSIRVRHHNGPVHTIPFGQIAAVTNFSRDWGTVKFELHFERDSDLELIRKTAKKVGLAMLEDPEFGSEFLIPLKMQGIQDVTDSSMIVRFKFTSRPGNPSIIKREGIKRLLAAFKAAGLELSSNAVTVRSGTSIAVEAAAANAAPIRPANMP